ncbi:hypothetical protein ACQHGV_13480 [Sphingomonas pseudosanguinis]|uniref:hypothetical protein n=1 Tax=Sphingomonas pseudosanguinis TaxID=413712 RepID=UPI003F826081
MTERVDFDLTDYPITDPTVGKLKALLGATPIEVDRQALGPAGACYWIADDVAKQNGASVQHGWMIEWLPNVYIQAMHHAVVKLPNGQMVDVTAPQRAQPSDGVTAFIPDDSVPVNLQWPASIENRYVILVDDEDVEQAIQQYRVNNSAMIAFNKWAMSVPGASWSPFQGWQAPAWPSEQPSDEPLRSSFRLMHEARRRIRDRYL